ncbi:MAG: epimerase, partial [Pseudomonadota bacterium]|nr:epimerase [Pseudomonadota bacterium]
MNRPAVLILGATGRFGAAAASAFSEAGWRVLAQSRRPARQRTPGANQAPMPAHTQALRADLADIDAIVAAAAPFGVRTVVYAVNPIYTRWDTDLLPLARHGFAVAERL